MKQFAPACERNKEAILAVLREVLPSTGTVLEIGSGTGQHAAYFASHLPHLVWQPTDLLENLPSIRAWRDEAAVTNLREPVELDVASRCWPVKHADAVVCINTIHIVAWESVVNLLAGVGRLLVAGGVFYVYGAYRYADRSLEPSNVEFDRWLKARNPHSGIRDFEAVNRLAHEAGLSFCGDRAMSANNRSIWWTKRTLDVSGAQE